MLDNIPTLSYRKVASVTWKGSSTDYDLELHALGKGHKKFMVVNPYVSNKNLIEFVNLVVPSNPVCVTWNYKGEWVVKLFDSDWTPKEGYYSFEIDYPELDWTRNPAIGKDIDFKNDPVENYQPVKGNEDFELIWYVDPKFNSLDKKVWALKAKARNKIPDGIKNMGYLKLDIAEVLDVVFISYDEPNAETNWLRVLEKAPHAKRVKGVIGILDAHKAAARLSTTDMFYVVDGDAYLTDDWTFDFQPGIFDRDCAYVWSSQNPLNNLTYQNGGVKLFPKEALLKAKKWNTLDMFSGVMSKIKAEDTISCIGSFNVDPFITWRSAFRECVKLYSINQMSRLTAWIKSDITQPFGEYAVEGAKAGYKFAEDNKNKYENLKKINNFEWLKEQFEKTNDR